MIGHSNRHMQMILRPAETGTKIAILYYAMSESLLRGMMLVILQSPSMQKGPSPE